MRVPDAASSLIPVYCILDNQTTRSDFGTDRFDRRGKGGAAIRWIRRLQHLGFEVQGQPPMTSDHALADQTVSL
jgi:hypothetical protein